MPQQLKLASRVVISRIVDYLKRTEFPQNGNLGEEANFIVNGARIYDDAPVTKPFFTTPRLGKVHGRYIDVISWAVQQPGFYREKEIGEIKKDAEPTINLQPDHSLDSLL